MFRINEKKTSIRYNTRLLRYKQTLYEWILKHFRHKEFSTLRWLIIIIENILKYVLFPETSMNKSHSENWNNVPLNVFQLKSRAWVFFELLIVFEGIAGEISPPFIYSSMKYYFIWDNIYLCAANDGLLL